MVLLMISVKVLLFSVLKEKVGRESIELKLPQPVNGKELLDRLSLDYEPIGAYRDVIRIAVNESYVADSHAVLDGDEVALITPVSGG